jgi:hypothetical protein
VAFIDSFAIRAIASSMMLRHALGCVGGLTMISRIETSARNCALYDASKSTEANIAQASFSSGCGFGPDSCST